MTNVYIKRAKFLMNLSWKNLKMYLSLLRMTSVLVILQKNRGIKQGKKIYLYFATLMKRMRNWCLCRRSPQL